MATPKTMRITGWLAILLLGAALGGCASKDFKEPAVVSHENYDTARNYKANFEATWKATMEVMRKYSLMVAKKESGHIITDWVSGKSDILYSGFDENRIPYTIRYRFTVTVSGGRSGTSISVKTKEQYLADAVSAGVDFSGSLYQWIDTKSSTYKEHRLLNQIGQALNEPRD
jgi:hypothetical protein